MIFVVLIFVLFSISFSQDSRPFIQETELIYLSIVDSQQSLNSASYENYHLKTIRNGSSTEYIIDYFSEKEKINLQIDKNYDLIAATYQHLSNKNHIIQIKKQDKLLIYVSPFKTNRIYSPYRTVVFPEFQLRDYFLSRNTNAMAFDYLMDFTDIPTPAKAYNYDQWFLLRSHNAHIHLDHIEQSEWEIQFYFTDQWVAKKIGRFNAIQESNVSTLLEIH